MNEILQLHRDDLIERDGVHCFRIDTRHEGQRLKNPNSRRVIPVHPRLVTLGWIDQVNTIVEGPLFDISRKRMSDLWADFSDDCGVTDPGLTFHSFRHSFIDGCRRARIEEAVQETLTGHSSPRQGRKYGSGYSIPTLLEAISKVSFPGFPR